MNMSNIRDRIRKRLDDRRISHQSTPGQPLVGDISFALSDYNEVETTLNLALSRLHSASGHVQDAMRKSDVAGPTRTGENLNNVMNENINLVHKISTLLDDVKYVKGQLRTSEVPQ